MTDAGETRAAAMLIAGAFMFAFGMFTVAFAVTFRSPGGGVTGAALIVVALDTVRRESKLSSNSEQLAEAGAA